MAWKAYDSGGAELSRSVTDLPVGTVVGNARSSAPVGWLDCDGSAVSRTAYPELFAAIGTSYGSGNGTTTFNLPNSDGNMILAVSAAEKFGINDGSNIVDGSITPAKLATTANTANLVTSLPSNPVDGQVVCYQSTTSGTGGGISGTYTDTMATVGAIWQLRYNASSSSLYKWEFIGGTPTASTLNDYGQAISRSNGNGWGDATSGHVSPTLVVPLAGDYHIELTVQHIRHAVSDGAASIGVSINGATPAGPVNLGTTASGTGNSPAISTTIQGYQNGLAANSTLKIQYAASGSSSVAVYNGPRMILRPVRVG